MSGIDEAFMGLAAMVEDLLAFREPLVDASTRSRTHITAYEIELPVELDVVVATDGSVRLGSTPPLYHLATSFTPSLHQMRLRAEVEGTGR